MNSRFFDDDVHPDAERCIQPPPRTPEDDAYRTRVLRWSAAIGLALWLGMAFLLRLAGARCFHS